MKDFKNILDLYTAGSKASAKKNILKIENDCMILFVKYLTSQMNEANKDNFPSLYLSCKELFEFCLIEIHRRLCELKISDLIEDLRSNTKKQDDKQVYEDWLKEEMHKGVNNPKYQA